MKLDELSTDRPLNNRKGTMKKILDKITDVESKKVTINGERVMGYEGVDISDSIQNAF